MQNQPNRKFKISIVAPVHIPPTQMWIDCLDVVSRKSNCQVIIVDDSNGKIKPEELFPKSWDIYGYDRQEEELGSALYERFVSFQKSAACKNFGSWIAWRDGADIVIILDSDCNVGPDLISAHLRNLMTPSTGWTNPIQNTGFFSRGFPYAERELSTACSLGLWNNELDLYGTDRLGQTGIPMDPKCLESTVADGVVPLSGMNLAMWAENVPAMLFLPNFDYHQAVQMGDTGSRFGTVYKFRRHDDIWGGYIFQKIMAMQHERLRYGFPIVRHDTIVVPEEDAEEEVAMIQFENIFYNAVDSLFAAADLSDVSGYEEVFHKMANYALLHWVGTEWEPIAKAMTFWSDLFESTNRRI